MASIDELDKAIGAHGMWKTRLKTVIEKNTTDVPVDAARQDNLCVFGKWLYGNTLTAMDKTSNHYKTVKGLHAEFHRTAARVIELALNGKKAEAEAMMAHGGAYATVSSQLTMAMMEWRKVSK